MSDAVTADVCRTPEGGKQANTVTVCMWCRCKLKELIKGTAFKPGASGDDVKKLHEHLKRFGMTVELSDWKEKDHKFEDSADLKNGAWGAPTTRALRMFALHPQVGSETARTIKSDGKTISVDLMTKIQEWCSGKVLSPKNYWEFKSIDVKAGDLDAAGAHASPEKQTVLHDYIVQIETDLCKTGFGVHSDGLCNVGAQHKPKGVFEPVKANAAGKHEDKNLSDVPYLMRKFQRQAQWLWRMKADGTHLDDAKPSDESVYAGSSSGEVDAATAKVLHAWVMAGLHMVINKFPLSDLEWTPGSGSFIKDADSGSSAKVRQDAHEAWDHVASEIAALNATIAGPYASSPRSWKGGKKTSPGASPFSWHYSALAIDLSQALAMGDATISEGGRYGLEEEAVPSSPGDSWFRIWCWVVPQPAAPAAVADDETQAFLKYRNRNIKYKHVRGTPNETRVAGAPTAASTLYFTTKKKNAAGTGAVEVTAREGWYVDISAIFEKHGWRRIKRHRDWLTNDKGWEFWHYQYEPSNPPGATGDPTFGEYLQIFGVHEARLRAVGWSAHEDIDHAIG